MNVVTTLAKFDHFLYARKERFEAIVIGGAALNIMSVINRETIDVDCLDPTIPMSILEAASDFRKTFPELGLIEKWLNNGPETLIRDLEHGWRARLVTIFKGKAIEFQSFAFCDRDTDLNDCIKLKPTREELDLSIKWVKFRDANPLWPKNVEAHFNELRRLLGYESN